MVEQERAMKDINDRLDEIQIAIDDVIDALSEHGSPASQKPTKPKNLLLAGPTLSWDPSDDPDGVVEYYEIYKCGRLVAFVQHANTQRQTWLDVDFDDGSESYFVVAVDNDGNYSEPSD